MLTVRRCLVSGALAFALSAGTAAADEQQGARENCDDKPTPEARVACLERQSRQRSREADAGFPAADDALGPAGLSEQKTDGQVPTAEPAAPIAPPSLDPAMPSRPEIAATPERADDASPPGAGGKPADDFEPGKRYPAKVASIERVERDRLRLELANGEVWRQTGGAELSAGLDGAETFEVELWRTPRGAFRMHIPDAGETIRVERIE